MTDRYREPAYDDLRDDQLKELLDRCHEFLSLPGYIFLQPERLSSNEKAQVAIAIYFDARTMSDIDKIPCALAGLPVVIKAEDTREGTIRVVDSSRPS